jgi:hypothetical protein
MTSRPPFTMPRAAVALLAACAALGAPAPALADAAPADASSPVTDNAPPKGIHPVVGALLTGTVGSDDQYITNGDGSAAHGSLGGRYEVFAGAEFPLTAGGLRLRLTAGAHVGPLSGPNGATEHIVRFPLEASLMYPLNVDLRFGIGARYPMRLRIGGGNSDLSATPSVMFLADYRVAPHVTVDMRYVVERYTRLTGGSADASHFGLGASAMY